MMNISTPALLFTSISLLFLAYTNRFTALSMLIRHLYDNKKHLELNSPIPVLRKRIQLVKLMQMFAVLSFMLCTCSLFTLSLADELVGKIFFTVSIFSLLTSLFFVLWELILSTRSLDQILERRQEYKNNYFKNNKVKAKLDVDDKDSLN